MQHVIAIWAQTAISWSEMASKKAGKAAAKAVATADAGTPPPPSSGRLAPLTKEELACNSEIFARALAAQDDMNYQGKTHDMNDQGKNRPSGQTLRPLNPMPRVPKP